MSIFNANIMYLINAIILLIEAFTRDMVEAAKKTDELRGRAPSMRLSGWRFQIGGERKKTNKVVASITPRHHMRWIMQGAYPTRVECTGRGYVLD
jgi:hypothetical protein